MPVTREDMGVVERVASRFVYRKVNSERDDLVSDGMLVLDKAVRDWESNRGLREEFDGDRNDFLVGRVKRGMIDGIRQRNGRSNSGFAKQRFREGMERLDATVQYRSSTRTNETMLDRMVGDLDRDLEDVGVLEMLEQLPPREREIVERLVIHGETELSIAKDFGVTESRISQLRSQALRRLRGEEEPWPRETRFLHGLSPRELETLNAMADGLTNREISARMFLSEEGVKSHVRHILQKLDARSRTHAVSIAFRSGLVS